MIGTYVGTLLKLSNWWGFQVLVTAGTDTSSIIGDNRMGYVAAAQQSWRTKARKEIDTQIGHDRLIS